MDAEGVTIKASDVLKKYQDEFCKEVDAKFNLLELKRKEVIPDGLVTKIENADDRTARELLFEHLHCYADVATLREYCRIIISKDGYPKMQALGKKMLHDLEPEGAGQTCGETSSQAGAQGSQTSVLRPSIIPDIKADYVEVKGKFVDVCTAQGTPTLDKVKEYCFDLIEGALADMPRVSRHEEDIEKAETMNALARVVCFRLSKWVSYDFFQKVITHFQPALKNVKERLELYEDQLKPLLWQKLENIAELQKREDAPGSMAELVVKYRLDADGLFVKDLIAERDFLAQRLDIPEHLLQVLSWEQSSVLITYLMVRDLLPLAELALCREDVRPELTRHGVEEIYLGSHPSEHSGLMKQSLQTLHLQRRTIVTVLDAHCLDLAVTSVTSDLKDMGVLTAEQCQKVVSLDDKERRHEALLYTLLASERPDTFHKLVGCMGLRDGSTAADLQATFKSLVESPGALSVISSSQCTPESPEERAGSQVVEAVGGEVPPQQTEQAEPSRGGTQPNLEEERFAGEPRQDEGLSHLQLEEGTSRMQALELEFAEAREAKEKLEEEVRRLQEELERNVTEQAVAKERLEEDVRHLQAELARRLVQVEEYFELQEQHEELKRRYRSTEDEFERFKAEHVDNDAQQMKEKHEELKRRYRSTEDEFELFKAEHADCDVSKKKEKAQTRTETERPSWWRRLLGRPSTTQEDEPEPEPEDESKPMDSRLRSDVDYLYPYPSEVEVRPPLPVLREHLRQFEYLREFQRDPEEPEVTKD